MGKTLSEIAEQLRDVNKKVQLIYAFNGVGKTRLSREFKELIAPKGVETEEEYEGSHDNILYYNAFTEDLFYWDNDLDADINRKLIIRPNGFTNWIFSDQGQEGNVVRNFQNYTDEKLTPKFNEQFDEVTFSYKRGNDEPTDNIKVSKGEESCLIWSIFYSFLEQIVNVLNTPGPTDRETNDFDMLEYIFIDDPVSSLDDTHLIELAVDIAELIKSNKSELKFIITTHNPLFYNILYNELNSRDKLHSYIPKFSKYRLNKLEDISYELEELTTDSPFSYHLYLLSLLEKAVEKQDQIQKYHFGFLRNILEKTSTFLGYSRWEDLLPEKTSGERDAYAKRILNYSHHSKHSGEEIVYVNDNDKRVLEYLVKEITKNYHFKSNKKELDNNEELTNDTI